ncbi:MAG TPA: FtsQ-type POTRA domain-containing protein [Stellaceae bacterium]|nr:FtsQ-type POTRA domain-containing protein [Stellaceae bacterium]
MRFLSAPADPERAGKASRRRARRERRSWIKPAAIVAASAALAIGTLYAHLAGADARTLALLEAQLLAATGRTGLTVTDVVVEGRNRVDAQTILAALGARRGTPILAIDPAAARARLEALPWVRSASVTRLLPDTLRVRIEERVPLALWRRGDKLVLVDRDGVAMPTASSGDFANLIELVGDEAPGQAAALLDMMASEPTLAVHVVAAVRVGGRRWNLQLDDGITVELPELEPLAAWRELARLDRTAGLLRREIKRVDLRFADRMVLETMPPPNAPAAPKKKNTGRNT